MINWIIENIVSKGDYLYAKVPNHPNCTERGYVLLHRIIVENSIDRLLTNKEVVHHKNGNKFDNRFENLEVMSHSEHAKLHHPYLNKTIDLVCSECGIKFKRKYNNRPQLKNQLNNFCSRSCNGKFQRRLQLNKPL